MKFYLMRVKRTDILEYYGHEILYINKRPMIYNYVECCSYKFGGNIDSENLKWTEVSKEEILEVLDKIIIDRSSSYHKRWSEINGISLEEQEKDLKSLKKFRNKIISYNEGRQ